MHNGVMEGLALQQHLVEVAAEPTNARTCRDTYCVLYVKCTWRSRPS